MRLLKISRLNKQSYSESKTPTTTRHSADDTKRISWNCLVAKNNHLQT